MFKTLKAEKLRSLFDCKFCSKILDTPITLTCGITICQSHLDEVIQNECKFCDRKHVIPEGGFTVNGVLKEMLDLQLDSIKLSPKYESCQKKMGEIKSTVYEIEKIEEDPDNFIYEYFDNIKRAVDLKRETLKNDIDNYSDRIIKEIEKITAECYELSKKAHSITKDINILKDEFNNLYNHFDSLNIDDQQCEDITAKIDILKPKFDKSLDIYKDILLKDEDYFFDHAEISIEDFFGKFSIRGKFPDSTILNKNDQIDLMELCEFSKDLKWKLAYKASSDGFGAKDFHAKCDGISNTLTIVKTTRGNIFGGYTDESWESGDLDFKHTQNAFIFSLKNEDDNPFKALCIDPKHAICNERVFGPVFGEYDFIINSDSNEDSNSDLNESNFGYGYTHPNYPAPSYILTGTGTDNFHTTEIEVYYENI